MTIEQKCEIYRMRLEGATLQECADKFGVSKEEAILSATRNPAKALGCDDEIGAIAPGMRADFVVCDENLDRQQVWLVGKKI